MYIVIAVITSVIGFLIKKHFILKRIKRDFGTDIEPEKEIEKIIRDAKKAKDSEILKDMADCTKVAEMIRVNLENRMAEHRKKHWKPLIS